MNKPPDEKLKYIFPRIYHGFEMHDTSHLTGETTWSFPDGVKKQLNDDKKYNVWETTHSPSDPYDTSTQHVVLYIEEYFPSSLSIKLTPLISELSDNDYQDIRNDTKLRVAQFMNETSSLFDDFAESNVENSIKAVEWLINHGYVKLEPLS